MARGEINIVVTPDASGIVQGQRSDTQRPESGRVSEIAGLMSATTQFAVVMEPQMDEEKGRRDGERQALEMVGSTPSYGPASVSGPDDPAYKAWQKGYDEGKKTVEGLFKR